MRTREHRALRDERAAAMLRAERTDTGILPSKLDEATKIRTTHVAHWCAPVHEVVPCAVPDLDTLAEHLH